MVDNGLLRLRAASVEHGGEYLCTALNVVGSDQQSATLTVTASHGQSLTNMFCVGHTYVFLSVPETIY